MKPYHLAPFVASLLTFSTPAVAQNAGSPAAAAADPAAPIELFGGSPAPEEKRFNLELPADLPAEEAISLVAKQAGQPLNVIWTGNSAQTLLPALRLHQVTLRELFAAIDAAGEAELTQGRSGYSFQEVKGAPNIFTFAAVPAKPHSENPLVGGGSPKGGGDGFAGGAPADATAIDATTRVPAPGAAPGGAASGKMSEFFDLSNLLDDELKVDDLTTAIRTAWSAAGNGGDLPSDALRYHQETQLLIASGAPEHLQTVRSIVELLKARHAPSQDAKDREILQLRNALEQREKGTAQLQSMLDETQKQSANEAAKMRDRITELEIELAKERAQR